MRKTTKKRSRRRAELKRELLMPALSLALLIIVSVLTAKVSMQPWLTSGLSILPVIAAAVPVAKKAVGKKLLSAETLVILACIGTAAMGNFGESYAVMLIFALAGCFGSYADGKARGRTPQLCFLRPEYVRVEQSGKVNLVDPSRIRPGTVMTVEKDELIPLDGIVVDGTSTVDAAPYTGKETLIEVGAGIEVVSGCINRGSTIKIRTTQLYSNSTLVRTSSAAENAPLYAGRREVRLSKITKHFTPIVFALAVILAVTASIITGDWVEWVHRALIFLVAASGARLLSGVWLSYFSALCSAVDHGIIIRGKNELDALAAVSTVVMDKTGTVTEGSFSVIGTEPIGISSSDLIMLAAAAEYGSTHPIAVSLRRACPVTLDEKHISDMRELPGRGVEAKVYGRRVLVGNEALMRSNGITCRYADRHQSVVHVAADGIYYGYIIIDDRVKDGAKDAVRELYALGIEKTVLLTGDSERTGRTVGKALGVSEVMTQLMPEDKVVAVDELMREKHAGRLTFVGDAISDARVLARSDCGVAMGAMNPQAAASRAPVLIMSDDIRKLPQALRICKRAAKAVKLSVVLTAVVKLAVILLAAFGSIGMAAAVAADCAVSVLTDAAALRIYGKEDK